MSKNKYAVNSLEDKANADTKTKAPFTWVENE